MLLPKRVKHRKQHRGRMTGKAKGQTVVHFGEFGLQALEPGWVTSRQIEERLRDFTPRDNGYHRGVLAKYAKLVGTASRGAASRRW